MAGNTIGEILRLTTFGESHGTAIGAVIDGYPSGIEIDTPLINKMLSLRKPTNTFETTRKEPDEVQFLSGVIDGVTLGTPISFVIKNQKQKSEDYNALKDIFRPSHADFTYQQKYGIRDYRGGGRASARETATRVVAGALALQVLKNQNIDIIAYTSQIGDVKIPENCDYTWENIEKSDLLCPDKSTEQTMFRLLENVKNQGDTIGGAVTCMIKSCPAGLGEPVFGKLNAELAKAMMSIPSAKAFEVGLGINSAQMLGSEYIDEFNADFSTKTNNSGGIQGGISNGMDISMKVTFHPIATLKQPINVITEKGEKKNIQIKGRHDCCQIPRTVPIVASMAAFTILDNLLLQKKYNNENK